MSKATIRSEIDVICKALNVNKTAFGTIQADGMILESQKNPQRVMTKEAFEAEKKAQGYTKICYLIPSWLVGLRQ